MERVNWNQAVRPSTHDLITAINSGADDIERIDGALDALETVVDGKADASGTYPDFVAGEALSIRSGIRSNTFLSHALDADVADGIAEVQAVKGNTVVWNQLANDATMGTLYCTAQKDSDGVIEITATVETTNYYGVWVGDSITANTATGHKVLIACEMKGEFTQTIPVGITSSNTAAKVAYTNQGEWQLVGAICTITTGTSHLAQFYARPSQGITWPVGSKSYVRKRRIVDLTTMYGAGNEPTSIADFYAEYGNDDYAYSAPTLLSSNIAGIEGAGACEFPAQTLRGIGTAQDVMTSGGIERVIGEVDLGTLTWTAQSDYFYTTGIATVVKKPSSNNTVAAIKCVGLTPIATNNLTSNDKTIGVNINGILYARNTAWTTLEQALAGMDGMYLFYELATPTTETFTAPIDLTYRVQADGSEAWIVPDNTQSAAVTGEIGYPLDPARALITHESFADFCDKLGAYLGATITETWDGSKYTYSFASGRSALLGSIESDPDALEVTEKDDMVKEIIEDERKEL